MHRDFEEEACKVKEKLRAAKLGAEDAKDLVQTVLDAGACWEARQRVADFHEGRQEDLCEWDLQRVARGNLETLARTVDEVQSFATESLRTLEVRGRATRSEYTRLRRAGTHFWDHGANW